MKIVKYNFKKIMMEIHEHETTTDVDEGADLYCPHCNERLGKQSEVEMNTYWYDKPQHAEMEIEPPPGTKMDIECSTCGKKHTHKAEG